MEGVLNSKQIEAFIREGFVRIDNAFDRAIAEDARAILWKDIDARPGDRSGWTKPVVRLGWYSQEPFVRAANTEILHTAFNQLVGEGRWTPRMNLGSFPVRFPSAEDPGDTGWHVDGSFPGKDPHDFSTWRVNVRSRGRALLMLFLFSNVGEDDAPTRIRVGSHLDVAGLLSEFGDEGLSFMDLAARLSGLPDHEQVVATGKAGTVYLCHPFIVHGAQPHRGKEPRFLAQPPLELKEELMLTGKEGYTPVEEAVRRGMKKRL